MLKNARLISDFAREENVPVYSGGTANQGLGEENVSAVIKQIDRLFK